MTPRVRRDARELPAEGDAALRRWFDWVVCVVWAIWVWVWADLVDWVGWVDDGGGGGGTALGEVSDGNHGVEDAEQGSERHGFRIVEYVPHSIDYFLGTYPFMHCPIAPFMHCPMPHV